MLKSLISVLIFVNNTYTHLVDSAAVTVDPYILTPWSIANNPINIQLDPPNSDFFLIGFTCNYRSRHFSVLRGIINIISASSNIDISLTKYYIDQRSVFLQKKPEEIDLDPVDEKRYGFYMSLGADCASHKRHDRYSANQYITLFTRIDKQASKKQAMEDVYKRLKLFLGVSNMETNDRVVFKFTVTIKHGEKISCNKTEPSMMHTKCFRLDFIEETSEIELTCVRPNYR
ncbi:hypothetical protein CDIK_1449 [Cucumispora dikerogammari]|nr:hypothetical protein CDIK_1449 [Cucumispora dikerogammari]